MKLHAAVARTLSDHGVDTTFGVMGDANMLYLVDFREQHGGTFISTVSEGGAVSMADGYSRVSGRLGVASVTHGPGLTNTMTALTEAVRARTPLVLITGAAPPDRNHPQHIDVRSAATLTGADYWAILDPISIFEDLAVAFSRARSARLPVIVDIPAMYMDADVPIDFLGPRTVPTTAVTPDEDELDRALGIIASFVRPVVIAGRGAALSGARDNIVEFADLIGAPLATSLLGKDLFRGHPFDVGICGTVASDLALDTFQQADCVIAFGASLNRYTTARGSLLQGKAVVHVDLDESAIGRHSSADVALVGDARQTAHALIEPLRSLAAVPGRLRTEQLRTRIADYSPRNDFEDASTPTTVDIRSAMLLLDERLPSERTVVTDTGRFMVAPWRYLHATPTAFVHTANFASIGLGLATAIGAAAADHSRVTVGVAGDGGAMMGLIELSTAVRHGIPLVVVVLNDHCYGSEYSILLEKGVDPSYSFEDWPSFAAVARSLGADGVLATTLDEFGAALDAVRSPDRPLLIEVACDPALDIGRLRP